MTCPLFDTHAHLVADDWELYPPRPFTPDLPVPEKPGYSVTAEALVGMMDAQGVEQACLVQRGHLYGYDNSCIIDAGHAFPGRLHPVVILDPQDPATADRYRGMVKRDRVRGFRMAQTRPHILDTAWISAPPAMEVWKACADLGTPMTLIIFMNHLSFTLPLIRLIAGMFPDLAILLDHGAMPFGMTQYEVALARAAGEAIVMPGPPHFGIDRTIAIFEDVPNVHFKITEINMERLAAAEVRACHLVRRMVDGFGPDRVMWGSDMGQSMRWTYAEKAEMARRAADFLTEGEAHSFLHGNAARLYGLG